ncbi:MAG TPA: RNA pyrophosphohydrolase [Caulobacteraceae bacterium]|nr:RNA pyrophosphohydrolase [Caulobacteraceae bacterium]
MTEDTLHPLDLDLYRPNVGIVVFDRAGRVWLGRRSGARPPHDWQFPQGGVDPGEDWETAARRELMEETGITSVSRLGETEGWITYDFPPEVLNGPMRKRGFKGQRQKWFAVRFEGEDAEIDLEAHPPIEFSEWRWAGYDEVMDLVVPFKKDAYRQVLAAFRQFAG